MVQAQTLARLQAEPWPRTETMDVSGNAMQLPPTHDEGTERAALICTLFRANAQVCLRACLPVAPLTVSCEKGRPTTAPVVCRPEPWPSAGVVW